ncbi:hypothetical protein QFC19_003883 [Naganishia cerealis]|uniref:Uncharacterized protein n=1 Tax=Naganishia cerealis TaxID=610337 RepID=A0ACC2W0X6_9TREE|nr:hypothetical protein QFC19_003883 [Naganishia cerealis]
MDSARARAQEDNTVDLSASPPLHPAHLPALNTSSLHARQSAHNNMPTGTVPSNSQYSPTTPGTSGYDSPPTTPKGHPINASAADYLGRQSLIGFLGGGGTGVKAGMKGSVGDRNHRTLSGVGGARRGSAGGGKFYPPEQSPSASASFTSTISYLTRGIPRKIRFPLLALVFLFLFGTVGFKIAHERADTLERMQAQRFAAGLQKAYVVDASSPAAHGDVKGTPPRANVELQRDAYRHSAAQAVAKGKETEKSAVVVPFDAGDVVFTMTKREETAALISFITSTSNNALPATLDTAEPLDPQLVLDFDYTRSTAADDLEALVHDTYTMYPVVLFGQMRDPYYREMRKLFSAYVVTPPPLVIEVDQRADEQVLVGLLKRLLGIKELPVLMLNGVSAGPWSKIQEYVVRAWRFSLSPSPQYLTNNALPRLSRVADNGNFMKLIATQSTAKIHEKKLKKRPKGVKDAERAENERILAPKPLVE